MPQLDTSTWPPQLIWLAITFFALYFIVSRVIIPRTGGVIHKRKSTIEGDLASAQRLKSETEAAMQAHEAALAEARGKANGIAQANRAALTAEMDAERAKIDGELAAKIAAAEKTIAASKAKTLADVKAVASDIAHSIVGELTGAKITKKAAAEAVAKIAK